MTGTGPELWQPGETHAIPRLYGRAYDCEVLLVTPSTIHFRGPIGLASITRELYGRLTS